MPTDDTYARAALTQATLDGDLFAYNAAMVNLFTLYLGDMGLSASDAQAMVSRLNVRMSSVEIQMIAAVQVMRTMEGTVAQRFAALEAGINARVAALERQVVTLRSDDALATRVSDTLNTAVSALQDEAVILRTEAATLRDVAAALVEREHPQ